MTNPDPLLQRLADVIEPLPFDLLEAREIVLATLAEKPTAAYQELVEQLLNRRDVSAGEEYGDRLQINRNTNVRTAVDANDPIIVRRRVDRAVRETLALLIAEGMLTTAAGTQYGEASIDVPYSPEEDPVPVIRRLLPSGSGTFFAACHLPSLSW